MVDIKQFAADNKKTIMTILVSFIVGVVIGAYVTHSYFPRTVHIKGDTQTVVDTEIEYRDRTDVRYVPKEIFVNPITGEKTKEDTDVEINKQQPQIDVKFNGKDYKYDLLQGETQKFQDGKLVVDQSSQLKVDVSAQVQKQVEDGINKAFKEQAKKPKTKVGIEVTAGNDMKPDTNLRASRQTDKFDVDLKINKDKDVKGGITFWFR